jgi:hypothetical protein
LRYPDASASNVPFCYPFVGMCVDWSKIEAIAATVGAGATVFLAALTVPNLIMLWRYVRDTKRLAETASEQLESSQTPFVVLMVETSSDYSAVYRLENQGGGPAMNVTGWMEWPTGEKVPFAFSRALGRGGHSNFEGAHNYKQARIEYQSLGGWRYVTEMGPFGVTSFTRKRPD